MKALNVGSTGGLAAARRGACDLAGIHLLDPAANAYNLPFVTEGLTLLAGYGRQQGLVFRPDDPRFSGASTAADMLARIAADPEILMVNRNVGSGTRILIDGLLGSARPAGYALQAKSHNGVAVAVAQGRADWGMAIETVSRLYGLGFISVRPEQYDFVAPAARRGRPAVRRFADLLASDAMRAELRELGFTP